MNASHEGPKTLVFNSGENGKNHTVPTVADHTAEPSGPVKVTVLPGNAYTVGSPSSASVTVNDVPPIPLALDEKHRRHW